MLVCKQSNGTEVRTYSRKRPRMQVIYNSLELCRLCLNKTNHMTPIFSEESNELRVSLASKIITCLGLEVTEEDEFPKHICELCHTQLDRFYNFKMKCASAFHELKNNLPKTKSETPHQTPSPKTEKLNIGKECGLKKPQNLPSKIIKIKKSLIRSNPNIILQLVNHSLETKVDNTHPYVSDVAATDLGSDPVHQNLIFKVANQDLKVEVANQSLSLEVLNQNSKAENCLSDIVNQSEMRHQQLVLKTENQNAISEKSSDIFIPELSDHLLKSDVVLEETIINDVSLHGMDYVIDTEQGINIDQEIIGMNVEMREEEDTIDPKEAFASYLVTQLVEKGVLAKRGDCLEVLNREAMTFTILTPYGSPVIMQLAEEDPEVTSVTQVEPKVTKEKPKNSCPRCGLQLASRGALVRHARVHSGEKPFECGVCGRAFAQREVLRRHQLLHADKLPFQCEVCPKAYTQSGALLAHSRRHARAPPPPLRCPHCPKHFLHASGLSRHMRSHAGLVYICASCERSFRDRSSLVRHARYCPRPPRGAS